MGTVKQWCINLRFWVVLLVVLLTGVCATAQSPPKNGIGKQDCCLKAQKRNNAEQDKCATQLVIPPITCQISPEETQANATKLDQDTETQRKLTRYTEWLVFVGVFQIIALIVQAVVFWFTLRQMKDSSQRQLRAYVCISSCMVRFQEKGFEVQLNFRNYGQTPAYEATQTTNMYIGKFPLEVPLFMQPEPNPNRSITVIPPNTDFIIFEKWKRSEINAPAVTLGTKQRTLYVYGEIVYKDAFKSPQRTQFRLIFGGENGGRKGFDEAKDIIGYLQTDSDGNSGT